MSVRSDILDNLMAAIQSIIDDPTGYEIEIAEVTRFYTSLATVVSESHRLPLVQIIDDQPEELLVADATNCMWALPVTLYGIVHSGHEDTLHEELNKMQSSLKQFLYSSPSLGDNALDLQFEGSGGNGFADDKNIAWTIITARILYWTTRSNF